MLRLILRLVVAVSLSAGLLLVSATLADAIVQSHPVPTWQTNGRVDVIRVQGTTAYLGGDFTSLRPAGDPSGTGEVVRNHAAAISLTTGALLPWNPNVSGAVLGIALAGSTIYMGGDFSSVGGAARSDLAAVNSTSGAVLEWDPTANKEVNSVRIDGSTVYAGGAFTQIDGSARSYLAAIDTAAGNVLTSWAPSADGVVRALAFTSGDARLIIGGDFTHIDGKSESHIAALDPASASVLPWRDHGTRGAVISLAADTQGVYAGVRGVGGNFSAFNPTTGAKLWDGGTDGNVHAVAVTGGVVYFGGHFNNYCGPGAGGHTCPNGNPIRRQHLLAVDETTGALTAWNPSANSNLGVFAAASASNGDLLIGGDFTATGQRQQQGDAQYTP